MIDWNVLISSHDPLSDNSLLFLSELPFSENFRLEFEKLKSEDQEFLQKILKDSVVVDLGSGNPAESKFVRVLAEDSKSSEYIGIDQRFPRNPEIRLEQQSSKDGFLSTYVREDILSALRNFPKVDAKLVLFFVGLEPAVCDCPDVKSYVDEMFEAVNAIVCEELSLVFSFGTHGMDPGEYGFDLVRNAVNGNLSVYKIFGKPF